MKKSKKVLFILLLSLAFCGMSVQAAPVKQGKAPEASVTIKEHHPGGAVHGGPAMHGGGGHAARPHAGGPAMRPHGGGVHVHGGGRPPIAPPPRHHYSRIAPMYVGVSYASPYYYDPYYYEYYDPYYYTYPVRPVVRYRVPNVGFSVMF